MKVPDLDPRIGNNFFDTNFRLTGGAEDAAVKEILRLHDEGSFTLDMPHSVKSEIEHRHTPPAVRREAEHKIYTIPVPLNDPEKMRLAKVRALIQGNARPGQHDNDAFHLFESAKYGGRHFITNDERLLKKAEEIWELLQIKVLKPSDFMAAYLQHARNRPPR
jgi:predicted nucleic acid-binding protein